MKKVRKIVIITVAAMLFLSWPIALFHGPETVVTIYPGVTGDECGNDDEFHGSTYSAMYFVILLVVASCCIVQIIVLYLVIFCAILKRKFTVVEEKRSSGIWSSYSSMFVSGNIQHTVTIEGEQNTGTLQRNGKSEPNTGTVQQSKTNTESWTKTPTLQRKFVVLGEKFESANKQESSRNNQHAVNTDSVDGSNAPRNTVNTAKESNTKSPSHEIVVLGENVESENNQGIQKTVNTKGVENTNAPQQNILPLGNECDSEAKQQNALNTLQEKKIHPQISPILKKRNTTNDSRVLNASPGTKKKKVSFSIPNEERPNVERRNESIFPSFKSNDATEVDHRYLSISHSSKPANSVDEIDAKNQSIETAVGTSENQSLSHAPKSVDPDNQHPSKYTDDINVDPRNQSISHSSKPADAIDVAPKRSVLTAEEEEMVDRVLRRQRSTVRNKNPGHSERNSEPAFQLTATTVMFALIAVLYVVAYIPTLIVETINAIQLLDTKAMPIIVQQLIVFANSAYFINSAINPILYCVFDKRFRDEIVSIVKRKY
jgi:hypothetical protein